MAIIIDATNLIIGRLAAVVAKQALLGETIDIVNAEKAVISGDRKKIFEKYKNLNSLGGPHWGPFFPKQADRYLRRVIKKMLPYKKGRGKDAFKRIMCWLSIPEEFSGKKIDTVKEADASKLPNKKYITLGELMEHLKHRK